MTNTSTALVLKQAMLKILEKSKRTTHFREVTRSKGESPSGTLEPLGKKITGMPVSLAY